MAKPEIDVSALLPKSKANLEEVESAFNLLGSIPAKKVYSTPTLIEYPSGLFQQDFVNPLLPPLPESTSVPEDQK